jgi:ribosomal protein L7/L12
MVQGDGPGRCIVISEKTAGREFCYVYLLELGPRRVEVLAKLRADTGLALNEVKGAVEKGKILVATVFHPSDGYRIAEAYARLGAKMKVE